MKCKDITNQKFTRYTALYRTTRKNKSGSYYWVCRCDCGVEKEVCIEDLLKGSTKSCGCFQKENGKIYNKKNIVRPKALEIGEVCGNFTIIGLDSPRYYKTKQGKLNKHTHYLAICGKCGSTTSQSASRLRKSKTHDYSCGCAWIKPQGEVGKNRAYSDYKYGSRIRRIEFTLSKEEFQNLVTKNCYYCNEPPNQTTTGAGKKKLSPEAIERTKFIHHGIDRIDSNKGYILDNCVPCCKMCNYMKLSSTQQEFYKKIREIYNHLHLWE